MPYATKADLAAYLGVAEQDLPADADRLLQRATELIDEATLGRIDPADTDHADAARQATCAVVEAWLQAGEERDITGQRGGVTLGSLRIDELPQGLPPRARRHLMLAGLLYRGVTV